MTATDVDAILLWWRPAPNGGTDLAMPSHLVARELALVRMSRATEGLEDWRAARIAELEGYLEAALDWEDMLLEGDGAPSPDGG